MTTALQRFFIGEPNDGGMFHSELYQAGDLFETQARAVEKIMVAIGAGNILAAGKDPVFSLARARERERTESVSTHDNDETATSSTQLANARSAMQRVSSRDRT
eukprot:COSAG03_NODE_521_length_7208_cov_11.258264_1_plen_104_part_00